MVSSPLPRSEKLLICQGKMRSTTTLWFTRRKKKMICFTRKKKKRQCVWRHRSPEERKKTICIAPLISPKLALRPNYSPLSFWPRLFLFSDSSLISDRILLFFVPLISTLLSILCSSLIEILNPPLFRCFSLHLLCMVS